MNDLDDVVNACLLAGFPGTDVPPWIGPALADGLAGVTLFPSNLDGADAVARLAGELRGLRPDGLVAIDEEGGDVTRLHHGSGSPYPGNLVLGAADDLEMTYDVAAAIAADLVAAGVNYNLAPSFDVNSDPLNPVIGVRSFGDRAALVAAHGASYVRAMTAAGVATAGKHFPGHGATVTDPHHALPVIDCDPETFRRRELAPFIGAIAAGVPSLMVAHAIYSAVDPVSPATMSRTILRDLLRDELGYSGVILSTAPVLESAGGTPDVVRASVRSLRAGADLLLLGPVADGEHLAAIRAGIVAAVRSGELAVAAVTAAAERVDAMRAAFAVRKPVATPADRGCGLVAARRGTRVTGDVTLTGPATVIELRAPGNAVVGDAYWSVADRLGEAGLVKRHAFVDVDALEPGAVAALAAEEHPLVVVVRDAYRQPRQRAWVERLLAARPDAVLVAVGMPDDAELTIGASICTLGAGRVNTQVAAELLSGGNGD